ncbi:hypothetical protein [Agromyces humi]|uniref:hypothetical protein n=1 Tax=Agromyces humi TaxID=1766800 RepID=UPI00135AA8CA|nr:hypothetical protein [Agromyces humi]
MSAATAEDRVAIRRDALTVVGENAARRLLRQQALTSKVNLHGDPAPTPAQMVAVLRSLADHAHNLHMVSDAVRALGRDDNLASGLGQYFHLLADEVETIGGA